MDIELPFCFTRFRRSMLLVENRNHKPKSKQDDEDAAGETDDRPYTMQKMGIALSIDFAGYPKAQPRCVQSSDGAPLLQAR
ncbi:hypothetical protein [Slackia piriformis]|uniref:hypothetical protein n=1 Tax=Slackia piriformis TaxID=626934 RepID=UPI0024938997|nr:hypothetical protein [Slackia piriformis]